MWDFVRATAVWLFDNILGTLVLSALTRLGLWLFRQPLDRKREIVFWVAVPILITLAVYVFGSSASRENHPDLRAVIETTMSGDFSQTPGQEGRVGAGFYLLVSVRNTGAASIVEDWALTIESSGISKTLYPQPIPERLVITDTDSDQSVMTITKRDSLTDRTFYPIPDGGMQRGWLLFIAEGLTAGVLRDKGNYTLTFKDVEGRQYRATAEAGGGQKELPPLLGRPGVSEPFIPQPKTDSP